MSVIAAAPCPQDWWRGAFLKAQRETERVKRISRPVWRACKIVAELRYGDYDVVDPDLADFDRLPVPNTERNLGHSIGAFAPGTTMR